MLWNGIPLNEKSDARRSQKKKHFTNRHFHEKQEKKKQYSYYNFKNEQKE